MTEKLTELCQPILVRMNLSSLDSPEALNDADLESCGLTGVELALDIMSERAALRHVVENRRVALGALAMYCRSFDLNAALAELHELLDVARRTGARCLTIVPAPLPGAGCPAALPGYQARLNFTLQLLRGVRRQAERTGVPVAVEACAGNCLLSPVELREMIDLCGSWAVGVCVDAARVAQTGCPADWIRTLQHRVHTVRLEASWAAHDTPNGAGARRILEKVLRVLAAQPYGGVIVIRGAPECDQTASMAATVRHRLRV